MIIDRSGMPAIKPHNYQNEKRVSFHFSVLPLRDAFSYGHVLPTSKAATLERMNNIIAAITLLPSRD